MAAEVKKTGNRTTKNSAGNGSTRSRNTSGTGSSGKSSTGTGNVKKNSSSGSQTPSKKRTPPESVNMNGRRNSATRSNRQEAPSELEKRGYITRKNPDIAKSREAKRDDIIIIVVTLICILMVLSYLKICGIVGTGINAFIFGLFGRLGYILPFIIWVLTVFIIANKDNGVNPLSIVYAVLLSAVLGALIQLAVGGYDEEIKLLDYFSNSSIAYEGEKATYGGLLGGLFVKLLCPFVGKVAAVLVLIALLLILFVLMTGKPFIMAVIRKINKRLSDYRRRRAIEKSEQEYYDDLDTDDDDDIPNEKPESRVRYGVRRMPGRRMGTMNVSFTKKGENEPEKNTAAKSDKVNANAKSGQTVKDIRKDPILEKERETAKVTVETKKDAKAKPQVSQNLFIPGVGNVRLGKNQSNDVIEEEYTEKDFADVMDDQIHTETEEKPKRETFRKQDVFEDNERITSVGVKTLHSGSINRTSGNNITNITSIYQKAENDEVMNGDGNNITEDNADELYDNRIYENADEDELYEKESEQNVITPAEHKDSYDEDEKIINVLNNENPDDVEDTEDISEKSGEQEELPIRDDSEKVYSDEKNLAKHVNEILDEQKENVPEKVSEAVKAEKEYQKVTRIGSGAAVFTDMTKQPEKKPEKQNIPEYVFPPVSLLNKSKPQQSGNSSKRDELEATIQKLQSTFESFGVGVKVVDASVGPTVTRYELLPDQGVKVKTITSLSDDIKLALAAPEIRIEAPIPGKAAVGIEVPNKESSAVFFGDLIDTDEFRKYKSNLAFTVGKDIGGKSIISDIGDMPHALIAGATGSGKSVCINALIMSILYKSKPTDVKLIMIDPKRVELVGYNGIPHLIVPVVTDVKKAAGALAWAVSEMDNRYKLFADAGVRDLAAYNSHMVEKWMEESNEGECPDKLPQIVIIVDELNDLMMTANSKDIESDIARLTQLARACGIHVILATQRPSVNVITGTIKANIPTRIAFAVSSIVDSRTILDQAGAEKLLGKGDMLYYPRGYAKPVRLQGVFVSDKEVNEVVDFIKKQYKEMKYNELVSQHIEANSAEKSQGKDEGGQADANANDEFFEEAARLIIKKQKASVGMLQREFRIGFNRAARIMDKLAEDGIVGPEESTKPRKILMTMDEFEQYLNGK